MKATMIGGMLSRKKRKSLDRSSRETGTVHPWKDSKNNTSSQPPSSPYFGLQWGLTTFLSFIPSATPVSWLQIPSLFWPVWVDFYYLQSKGLDYVSVSRELTPSMVSSLPLFVSKPGLLTHPAFLSIIYCFLCKRGGTHIKNHKCTSFK